MNKKSLIFSIVCLIVFPVSILQAQLLIDCQNADKMAKVIFFRPFRPMGSAVGFDLFVKDSLRAKIRTKSFYVMELPTGKNQITALSGTLEILNKSKNVLDLTVESGKIYFVKCTSKSFSEGITKPNHRLLFKVLKKDEIRNAFRYKFVRKQIRLKLYEDFYNQSIR